MRRLPTRLSAFGRSLTNTLVEQIASRRLRRDFSAFQERTGPGALALTLVPGCLHIALKCLEKLPLQQKIFLISNGLSRWERTWVLRHFQRPLSSSMKLREHGAVVADLLRASSCDFGILDFDCFVLNTRLLEDLKDLPAGVSASCCFLRHERGRFIPETFLMYLSSDRLREVAREFGVWGHRVRWNDLSSTARASLRSLGLSEENLPEPHKQYFDTLRALLFLGKTRGLEPQFVRTYRTAPRANPDAIHIGGVSRPPTIESLEGEIRLWPLRGAYFWTRLLEACPQNDLREYYSAAFNPAKPAQVLSLAAAKGQELEPSFIELTDSLLDRTRQF